jgi:lipopolysaccharide export system permease protein
MLFDGALRRELSRRFWASWVVIFTIVITIMLIRTLSLASRGQLNPEEITLAMGYAALGRIATILAVALLVSVVMVLGRMQRESELVVWLANGMGPGHFVRPVLRFATPIVVVILALQWWVWPWSNAQLDQLRNRFEQRGDLQRIEPGRFQSSADGRRVFFIDQSSNTDNVASNVFIASQQGQREAVVSAASGRIERDDQGSSLMLDAGQRIERGPDGSKVLAFDHYHARVTQETAATSSVGIKSTPSLQLWQNPSPYRMAELTWRLGLAAAAFNFALLALALTRVNPRGSGNGLLLALLVAVIYINLLSISQGWVATQRMGPWALFGVLHGGLAGLALLAVAWRSRWRMRMRPLAAA